MNHRQNMFIFLRARKHYVSIMFNTLCYNWFALVFLRCNPSLMLVYLVSYMLRFIDPTKNLWYCYDYSLLATHIVLTITLWCFGGQYDGQQGTFVSMVLRTIWSAILYSGEGDWFRSWVQMRTKTFFPRNLSLFYQILNQSR